MAKYNWIELEKEYLTGDSKSVSAFLKEKGIPNNGSTRNKTKGWNEKKRQKQDKTKTKTIEKIIEKQSEKEADKILRVKDVANELLLKISEATTELKKDKDMFGNVYESIIDRADLKKLTSALKDISDIIGENKDPESSFVSDIEKAWSDRNEKRRD